jgi:putative redox protein
MTGERKQAISIRTGALRQLVKMRGHELTVDEPSAMGGNDDGPEPQELLAAALATCTAITMEMYAERKGWDVGATEVACSYQPAERGSTTRFELVLRFPDSLDQEQVDRLRVIAAKCPVHRTLDGEVMFEERVERISLAS